MSRSDASRRAAGELVTDTDGEPVRNEGSVEGTVDEDLIPVGSYYDGQATHSGVYDPERDVVLVSSEHTDRRVAITPGTWVEQSAEATVDRIADQLRCLLRDGELLDQPACVSEDCQHRLTSLEIDRSDQHGASNPRCKHCLTTGTGPGEVPPWVSPEDRTVDRSAVATVAMPSED